MVAGKKNEEKTRIQQNTRICVDMCESKHMWKIVYVTNQTTITVISVTISRKSDKKV